MIQQIIVLEDAAREKKNFLPSAQLLYSQQASRNSEDDVKQFQTLALCSRPEFIGYLRDRYQKLNPNVRMEEIQRYPRSFLCQSLLGIPNLRNIIMPIKVWDLRNVPTDLQDKYGFLDLGRSDLDFQFKVDNFLIKNYGVTWQEMKTWNSKNTPEELTKYQLIVKKDVSSQRTNNTARDLREMLQRSSNCGLADAKTCSDVKITGKNLCNWTGMLCETANVQAIQFLDSVINAYCQPNLELHTNEVGFIDLVFRILFNFFTIIKEPKPTSNSLDAKCNLNTALMTEFIRIATIDNKESLKETLRGFMLNAKVQVLNNKLQLFKGFEAIKKTELRSVWSQVATLDKEDVMLTAVLLLIYAGVITNVFPFHNKKQKIFYLCENIFFLNNLNNFRILSSSSELCTISVIVKRFIQKQVYII